MENIDFRGNCIKVEREHVQELISLLYGYLPEVKPILGQWRAACNGLERPFRCNGSNWLYVWNGIDKNAYLNLDTDIVQDEHPRGKNW